MTMAPTATRVANHDVLLDIMDVKTIKSVQLSTGWVDVRDAELTQFAIGNAHSPISASKVYPALKYRDSTGKECMTPLRAILSYSFNK